MTEVEKKSNAPKKSWFHGLRAEFNKIIWPDKKTLGKQTIAVLAITAVLGILITVIDAGVLQVIDFLIK
ncbi:MAG: preprotein translocase subunit SecE [Lachnospiraceae bacterium]|jgi:preprotein translocase subunit SecE